MLKVFTQLKNLYKRSLVTQAQKARETSLPQGILKWKNESFKVFEKFTLKNQNNRDIFLSVRESHTIKNEYKICLRDRFFCKIGEESVYFDKSDKRLDGWLIEVKKRFRKKEYGEILRLASIMELMENPVKELSIFSLKKALIFHTKYGFKPKVSYPSEGHEILKKIALIPNPELKECSEKARDVLISNVNSPVKYTNEAQKLASRVLKIMEQEKINVPEKRLFDVGMVLTKEDIVKNKEFYNALFKKHKINYEIKGDKVEN